MEKRATVIDSIRSQYKKVLVLDAGDLLNRRPQRWRHENIVSAYKIMQYDAIALGERDFVEGPEFLMTQLFALGNIVNTNIQYLDLTIGNPYKIFEFDSIRIGVTAVFDSNLAGLLWVKSKGKFTFKNPLKSLRTLLSELKNKCDFIILLFHGELERTKKLIQKFPEVNLVVNGHSQQLLHDPLRVGNTYLLQTDGEAYRLGKVVLHFNGRELSSFSNEMILLDDRVPNHPKLMELIREYERGPLKNKGSTIRPQSKIK